MINTNKANPGSPLPLEGQGEAFFIEMEVRDYECDIQGIVNNANYLHYLEHTRHKFIQGLGLSFEGLHNKGIDVVVARVNLQYKTPLRPEDRFRSELYMTKEGLRYVFNQKIVRCEDGKLCLTAKVETVCVINGRLSDAPELQNAFQKYMR